LTLPAAPPRPEAADAGALMPSAASKRSRACAFHLFK